MSSISSKNKVVVIGLDGASSNIIEPLVKDHKLPFVRSLIDGGSFGELNSTTPLNSASSWTSLFTGKNPGKHNIYDYLSFNNSSYQPKLITNKELKSKFIWNIANSYKLKTILLNVPVASEPEPVDGIMVSGILTPTDQPYAYPESIVTELKAQSYLIDSGFARHQEPEDYFNQIEKTLQQRESTFLNMIKHNPWDLAIVTINALDRAQHDFWDDSEKIEHLYVQIDSFLKSIYESIPDDCFFIVVSNHGFKSVAKKFFVNEWLWELGLLEKNITLKRSRLTDVDDIVFNYSEDYSSYITKLLAKTKLTKDNIRKVLPDALSELLKKITTWNMRKVFPKEYLDIVWDKTQAYFVSTNTQGININLKGREPQGTVNPGEEYERLRSRIINELNRLKDPYTLENVVDEVYRREEIFKGDYVQNAPDIIFVPHNDEYFLDSNKRTCRLFIGSSQDDEPIYSHHDRKGMLYITGPDVKPNNSIENITIYDVAPTIFHLLGIPSQLDLDGKVPYQIFESLIDNQYIHRPHLIPYEDKLPFIPDEYFRKKKDMHAATS